MATRTVDINSILAQPANKAFSIRGADMGRTSRKDGKPERLHLQRMWMVSYDYDTGGAYWGGWSESSGGMYCAFSPVTTANDVPIRVFVRALNRREAREKVLDVLPDGDWKFFR